MRGWSEGLQDNWQLDSKVGQLLSVQMQGVQCGEDRPVLDGGKRPGQDRMGAVVYMVTMTI